MKRILMVLTVALIMVAMIAVTATLALAAPITCPAGQTAVKTPSGWDCQNQGGHTNQSENPKNPNVGKGFF
jgi:hypothetical protein